ncbi:pyridoxal phosphate-dependent decarboxylase family protein [Blastococcus haudaquaticus]|uniref:Glutamate or tyrosine decarboxylase n=1 Tax=Blastococcus haudaquaticus TaxID=1938745 RepID=A0A286GED3_9ACTN|nr:aminotransferase class V-fold PLP-dependent enzyme [Blastococcus haudaquaticus]SOD93374.1 Glutamate or tyrosine decarboxylase [Blastococcus haudaquaticus]
MTPDQVLAELTALQTGDVPTHGGATMAYVYDSGRPEVEDLAARAQAAFQWTNALDPTAFPSVASIENDLVGAAIGLLGGDAATVGTLTSGGTESCLLAVLAARERWRRRGGTGRPRLLLPVTAHAAFRKAAHLFDLEVADVPVDPDTCRAGPAAVADLLDDRTALVVVSAPSYPHGVLDPVGEVAALAAAAGVPCHVDACIGGWILPFLDDVPEPFDLSVPGVTSLSVDLHKYGYAPKGVSVLLTADPELRQEHWFATAGWPGYPVVNPTLAGTRPAGAMAAAWAVHRWLGTDGYRALARQAHEATRALATGIARIDGLRVVGDPVTTLVAVAQDGPEGVDVLNLADEMTARGWLLQPQPPFAQPGGDLPATLHLTVTGATADRVDALLSDLAEAARTAAALPRPVADPDLVAAAATIDPGTLTVAEVDGLLELAGVGGGRLPERMAPVHALVAALPRPVAERLLAGVLDLVYRPAPSG